MYLDSDLTIARGNQAAALCTLSTCFTRVDFYFSTDINNLYYNQFVILKQVVYRTWKYNFLESAIHARSDDLVYLIIFPSLL
jgi:hypothetical protein